MYSTSELQTYQNCLTCGLEWNVEEGSLKLYSCRIPTVQWRALHDTVGTATGTVLFHTGRKECTVTPSSTRTSFHWGRYTLKPWLAKKEIRAGFNCSLLIALTTHIYNISNSLEVSAQDKDVFWSMNFDTHLLFIWEQWGGRGEEGRDQAISSGMQEQDHTGKIA